MTTTETIAVLLRFNEWRRGDYEPSEQPAPPDPCEISEAIDAAVEMIERLEAAESDALEEARLNGAGSEREAALMAKLEAAHEKADRIASELQDTVHKQAHEIERLRYLVSKTYYIHPETGNLHQVLMDNLLADVAKDVLESMK